MKLSSNVQDLKSELYTIKNKVNVLKSNLETVFNENKKLKLSLESTKRNLELSNNQTEIEEYDKLQSLYNDLKKELDYIPAFSTLPVIIKSINLYLSIAKETFSPRDFLILENYFSGKTTKEQASEYDLTSDSILNIINNGIKKVENANQRMVDLEKLNSDFEKLSNSYEELNNRYKSFYLTYKQKQIGFIDLEAIFADTEFFKKVGLSIRVNNVLRKEAIFCVNDMRKYTLSELKRFTGMGASTYKELLSFIEEHDIPMDK